MRVWIGYGELIRKIGTIPHYWEVRKLDDGLVLRVFVYPEDKASAAKDIKGTVDWSEKKACHLKVLRGGYRDD